MSDKGCLLISCGPSQLISGLALLQSKGVSLGACRVISLYDYEHEAERFSGLEREICVNCGVDYAGALCGLPEFCREQLEGNLFIFLNNKDKFFDNASDVFLGGYKSNITIRTLVIPFRPNRITDMFLLYMIRPDEIIFYQEGLYLKTNENILSKTLFKLAGLRDYNVLRSYYSLPFLPPIAQLSKCKGYIDKHVCVKLYDHISNHVFNNDPYQCQNYNTMLLWQDLYPRFVKHELLLYQFYKKLINKELINGNTIIIKPHPRCGKYQLEKISEFIDNNFNDNVTLMSADKLISLPAEIAYCKYKTERVVGVSSTGMFIIGGLYNAKVISYYDKLFSQALIKLVCGYNNSAAIETVPL